METHRKIKKNWVKSPESGAVDWKSSQTEILLNPRWPAEDLQRLRDLVSRFPLPSHVWIASSGSSASENISVKVIALSKKALLASAQAVNRHLQVTAQDIWAQVLPEFHVGGLGIEARAFLAGSQVVVGLKSGAWDPHYFLQVLEQQAVTLAALVPTQIYDLLQIQQKAPASLRAIVVGGGALSDEIYQLGIQKGWPLLPSFGMTECCSQIATATLDSWKKGERQLELLTHVRVRLNEEGLLALESPSLLTGFAQWRDGKAHWNDPKSQGWYQTEDRAEIQGSVLKPLGRNTEYIKVLGEGVDVDRLQKKLENIIHSEYPTLVRECVVVDLPDERQGHELLLVISKKVSQTQAHHLQRQFAEKVMPYERLTKIVVLPEIPRTELGKIPRQKLKLTVLAELKRKF